MRRRTSRYGALALVALPGAATLMSALAAVRRPLDDPDLFWIAAAGRELLERGALLRDNHFSFTAPEAPWVMHEWLLAGPYAWGLEHFGAAFFASLGATTAIALGALLLFATPGDARGRLAAAALFLPLFGVHLVSARPMVIALLPAAAMVGLAFAPRFGRWRLAAAIAVELVWVNLHGSFPFGLLLLAAGALEAGEDRRARWAATMGAALVLFAQPHGLALFSLVAGYVAGGAGGVGVARARLIEFQPLLGAGAGFVSPSALFGLAVLAVVGGWLITQRRRLARVALFATTLGLALLHARHADLAGLVGAMLLIPPAIEGRPWARPDLADARVRALLLVPAAAMLALPAAEGVPVATTLGGEELPALIDALPDDARVYTPFSVGGRVEWLAGERGVRVFYDSRNDCYPAEVARLAFDLEDGLVRGDDAMHRLRDAGTTHLVLPVDSPLARHARCEADAVGGWRVCSLP